MAVVLLRCRLRNRTSESHIAERLYERSALPDLFGVLVDKVNDAIHNVGWMRFRSVEALPERISLLHRRCNE
jgi:hypothetical protein